MIKTKQAVMGNLLSNYADSPIRTGYFLVSTLFKDIIYLLLRLKNGRRAVVGPVSYAAVVMIHS